MDHKQAPLVTRLILSPNEIEVDSQANVETVFHISKFSDAAGLMQARYQALRKVNTPLFCFVDVDDHLMYIPDSVHEGLLCGHEVIYQSSTKETTIHIPKPWTVSGHLSNPLLIHRAIMNTNDAKAVVDLMPNSEHMETILYYFMARWKGVQYINQPIYQWTKLDTGYHKKVRDAIKQSSLWIMENEQRVMRILTQK